MNSIELICWQNEGNEEDGEEAMGQNVASLEETVLLFVAWKVGHHKIYGNMSFFHHGLKDLCSFLVSL